MTNMLFEIFDSKAKPRPIGIDLGTTNSLVAYVRDGRPRCVEDCNGSTLLPSAVHYGSSAVPIVGEAALSLAVEHPCETIVSVKRFMGRGADDPETQRLGPYKFAGPELAPDRRMVGFVVHNRVVNPLEVSAEILRALRDLAHDELRSVGPCVITVPAYFDEAQRQATKDAGKLAGLTVLRLLNEPTAAALAYGLDKKQNGTFLVYDLGGGTFDVTILSLEDGVFQVRSTGGDSALGGDDMDRAIATTLLSKIPQASPSQVREALNCARQLKHALTESFVASVEFLHQTHTMTRETLESLIKPVTDRTIGPVRRALRDADLQARDLDGVILVGGATRVPVVRELVKSLLGKEPLADIDPEQVVAFGAAVQADLLAGSELEGQDVLLLDVTPLSLGIETMGGIVDKIVPRNTTIPTGARSTFTTFADNQTGFEIHVVQGEREMAKDCRSLARFLLRGIPKMPAGMARLEVTFRVDQDGLLKVLARELTTGIEQTVEVKPTYGLTDEEMEDMLIAALDHGEQDLEARRLAEGRVEAERMLLATRTSLREGDSMLLPGEREQIERAAVSLADAIAHAGPARLRGAVEALDAATKEFAGRRMNAAIATAIAGRSVTDLEAEVASAKGVDVHVEEHRVAREHRS